MVIGLDPGTVSMDLCGLHDGRLLLDRTVPTAEALGDPDALIAILEDVHRDTPISRIAGPSGYGLPLVPLTEVTDDDLRLAYLAADGEPGGIGGLRRLVGRLTTFSRDRRVPVLLTPGVIHLPTVPAHRKVNRVDMGTADKVCAAALAIWERVGGDGDPDDGGTFIFLELGGAFSAALAVDGGRIVDGLGGTSGPMGARAAGALDGEVAFLAGSVTKADLFTGGAASVATDDPGGDRLAPGRARDAYIEQAVKAVAALTVSVPAAAALVLSGRMAGNEDVVAAVRQRITDWARDAGHPGFSIDAVAGFAHEASHAAQGAALLADGLAGGPSADVVDRLAVRSAAGTVLDHLYVVSPERARARLGLAARRGSSGPL